MDTKLAERVEDPPAAQAMNFILYWEADLSDGIPAKVGPLGKGRGIFVVPERFPAKEHFGGFAAFLTRAR